MLKQLQTPEPSIPYPKNFARIIRKRWFSSMVSDKLHAAGRFCLIAVGLFWEYHWLTI
jgi:hypothetical protein